MIEGDGALEAARIDGERIVGDLRRGVEDVEEILQLRRLQEQAVHKADDLLQPRDQHGRQIHEGDDLADAGEALEVEPCAEQEDRQKGQRRGRPRRDGGDRPPGQDRHLRVEHRPRDLLQRIGFGLDAREALDHRDIAERVGDMFRERAVVPLHRLLQRFGAAQDIGGKRAEDEDQRDQHGGEAPVQRQRQRQQDQKGRKRGAILAEEGEPQAGHAVGAFEHDFQKPPRMGGAVEAQRKMQHMLEELRHHREPAPVREALGLQRDDNGDGNREQGEADPRREQGREIQKSERSACRLRAAQFVDDAPEQHRLGELRARQGEIGQRQKDRDALLAAEQAKDADVNG